MINKIGTPADQFEVFDKAFKTDSKSFQNPKSIYTYFKLVVGMFDKEEKSFQDLVDLYTTVTDKIELENKYFSGKVDALLVKEEAGTITSKEVKKLKVLQLLFSRLWSNFWRSRQRVRR